MALVSEYLIEQERIIAECHSSDWLFYATDKRVIKYGAKGRLFKREEFHDLSYSEISSVVFVRKTGSEAAFWTGLGVLLGAVSIGLLSNRLLSFTPLILLLVLIVAVAILGIFLLVYGVLYRASWYELKGSGLLRDKSEAQNWRIDPTSSDAVGFVKAVRGQLARTIDSSTRVR